MTGYRVIFDREKMVLGWKASDCELAILNMTILVCTPFHVLTRNLSWQVMILENQTIDQQLCPWTSAILLTRLRLPVWCPRPPREMQVQMNLLHRSHLFHHLDLQETMHHIWIPSITNLWWLYFPFSAIIWLLFLLEAFICPLYNIEFCYSIELKCPTAFLILQFIPDICIVNITLISFCPFSVQDSI